MASCSYGAGLFTVPRRLAIGDVDQRVGDGRMQVAWPEQQKREPVDAVTSKQVVAVLVQANSSQIRIFVYGVCVSVMSLRWRQGQAMIRPPRWFRSLLGTKEGTRI